MGIAISDASGKIAFPREVLQNDKNLLKRIATLCEKEKVEAIILGQSLNFKGNENPIQSYIANCKLRIESLTKLPVHYQSEILTSALASRNTAKPLLDASAAALILQSWLDKQPKL